MLCIAEHDGVIWNVLREALKILSKLIIRWLPLFNNEYGEEICPPWVWELIILNQVPMFIQFLAKRRYLSNLLHRNPLGVRNSNNIFASFDILLCHNVPIGRCFPSRLTLIYFRAFPSYVSIKFRKILSLDMIFRHNVVQFNLLFNFFMQNDKLLLVRSLFDALVQCGKCLFWLATN